MTEVGKVQSCLHAIEFSDIPGQLAETWTPF